MVQAKQQGVALISILLIVVLFSALAFQVYSHQSMATAQTRIGMSASQARHSLLAGETLARELLEQDWHETEGDLVDDLVEAWALEQPKIATAAGTLQFRVVDMSGRLNLNSIASGKSQIPLNAMTYVLNRVGISSELVPIWQDWIDGDEEREFFGGYQGREDIDWLINARPFRTPNALAGHLSELRILAAIEDREYVDLSQLVSLLPTKELSINVNTAHPEVLNSLLPNASTRMSSRGGIRNFGSVEAFLDLHVDFQEVRQFLSVQSNYFELRATVLGPDIRMDLTSQIVRDASTGESRVYAREFGTRHVFTS